MSTTSSSVTKAPAVREDRHEPSLFELAERFSYGHAADPELGRDCVLGDAVSGLSSPLITASRTFR